MITDTYPISDVDFFRLQSGTQWAIGNLQCLSIWHFDQRCRVGERQSNKAIKEEIQSVKIRGMYTASEIGWNRLRMLHEVSDDCEVTSALSNHYLIPDTSRISIDACPRDEEIRSRLFVTTGCAVAQSSDSPLIRSQSFQIDCSRLVFAIELPVFKSVERACV